MRILKRFGNEKKGRTFPSLYFWPGGPASATALAPHHSIPSVGRLPPSLAWPSCQVVPSAAKAQARAHSFPFSPSPRPALLRPSRAPTPLSLAMTDRRVPCALSPKCQPALSSAPSSPVGVRPTPRGPIKRALAPCRTHRAKSQPQLALTPRRAHARDLAGFEVTGHRF